MSTPRSSATRRRPRASSAGCTVAETASKAPPRCAGRPGPLGRLVAVELHERARVAGALDRREGAGPRSQLRGPGRRPEPALAPIVRVDPVFRAEGAALVHCELARAREPNGLLRPADLLERRELVPPRKDEAPVAAARAAAADVRLEEHDVERGLVFLQPDRGPEPAVAAATHADVGTHVALEGRGGLLAGKRILEPEAPWHAYELTTR